MLFLKVSGVGGGSKMQARGYQNDRLKGKRSKVRPKWAMRRQHKTPIEFLCEWKKHQVSI